MRRQQVVFAGTPLTSRPSLDFTRRDQMSAMRCAPQPSSPNSGSGAALPVAVSGSRASDRAPPPPTAPEGSCSGSDRPHAAGRMVREVLRSFPQCDGTVRVTRQQS